MKHGPDLVLSGRRFPIMSSYNRDDQNVGCPRNIPWEVIEDCEEQAHINHDQTLQRLAERGGLCPSEACAVLEGRRWRSMEYVPAVERLKELVAQRTGGRK